MVKKSQVICVFRLMKNYQNFVRQKLRKNYWWFEKKLALPFFNPNIIASILFQYGGKSVKEIDFFFSYCTDLRSAEIHPDEYATL